MPTEWVDKKRKGDDHPHRHSLLSLEGRDHPHRHSLPSLDGRVARSLEQWVQEELSLTFHRFCLLQVALDMAKCIANIIFQSVIGWWHTWSFSADYESPEVFNPIALMAIRAVSWMDVVFTFLNLLLSSMAVCGLIRNIKALLRPLVFSIPLHLTWRLLCVILYVCVAAQQTTELFTLYSPRSSLIGYILAWVLIRIPMDVFLFVCLRRQYIHYRTNPLPITGISQDL
ncbi:hypothetical protein BV898_00678 [Hypsibius exemplaris]|uniref:Uncharacterized protein n=1 Tax=Hypsibius exemplaris TaxID=2072580 RepID=A0A1W0XE46_HYPEX|nr:hypothetical protein BV898_00678 [Hypsibius exemplaris]